jgi:hypothetical protein
MRFPGIPARLCCLSRLSVIEFSRRPKLRLPCVLQNEFITGPGGHFQMGYEAVDAPRFHQRRLEYSQPFWASLRVGVRRSRNAVGFTTMWITDCSASLVPLRRRGVPVGIRSDSSRDYLARGKQSERKLRGRCILPFRHRSDRIQW